MKLFKFPIITITISFIFGILINHLVKPKFEILLGFLIVLFFVFSIAFIRSNKNFFQNVFFGISCYLFVLSIGAFSYYLHSEINYDFHYSKHLISDKNEIKGIVLSVLKPSKKYDKYLVTVTNCNGKKTIGKIILYHKKADSLEINIGNNIWFYKEIYATSKSLNPYQFDYSKYLENQNIFHQVYCDENEIRTFGITKNFDYYLQKIRAKLSSSFAKHNFSSNQKSILDALLLGQRTFMDTETTSNYSKAGVIHILAISGLHIGILYFFLAFLLKPIDKIRNGKYAKLVLIIAILWIFAFITGLPASVTRAVTLFTFISIGNSFKQQNNIFNAVAVSALLLLIFNPNFIFDVGFQLSYAAVISILLFQPFYKKIYFTKNKIGVYFIDIVLVSLAAQIGVLPLSLYYFNQLPLLFLVANIVIIPLASFVLIAGMISLMLNFVYEPLAILIGKMISNAINAMNQYISIIAKVENGIIENISFTEMLTITFYIVIFSFINWLYIRKWNAFRNALLAIILFQLGYFVTIWNENNKTELIVFNSKKALVSIKNNTNLTIYTNDSLQNTRFIKDYTRGIFNETNEVKSIPNCVSFHNKRILIVDSLSVYKTSLKPDIIVLTQNPRINLDRLINDVKPELIIVDNSNSFYKINHWKLTCEKEKIPFHATAEKGFYRLK